MNRRPPESTRTYTLFPSPTLFLSAGVVLHRAHLGRGPERVRDALGGPLVIGRETDPDMAIVENRIVEAIGLFDLVQRLRDQESLDTIARDRKSTRLNSSH